MGRRVNVAMQIILGVLVWTGSPTLVVQTPQGLKEYFTKKYKDEGIPYSIANFGRVPQGKSLFGQVVVPDVLEDCVYEDTYEKHHQKIVLVQRNDCLFTQKAINVQKDGGIMAIIIDNVAQDINNIIMVDDGHGADITIPTILISKADGAEILKYIKSSNNATILRIHFDIVVRNSSQLTLWLDASSRASYMFLRKFLPLYTSIKQHVQLSIYYQTQPCLLCASSNCFTVEYCKSPPPSARNIQNIGKQLISEQLRQNSLFKIDQSLWWAYMLMYDDQCQYNNIADCSLNVMRQLKVDTSKVLKDVSTTMDMTLNETQMKRRANRMVYFPAAVINGMVYRGNFEAMDVFDAVCSGIEPVPQGCGEYVPPAQVNVLGWVMFGLSIFAIFAVFIATCYRKIVRRKLSMGINKQVNQLVNQYITMYESDRFTNL